MNTKHRLWRLTVFCISMILCGFYEAEIHGAAAILENITISGSESVATASTATYTCNAIWSDGTTSPVRPTWSVTTNYASVSETGVVTNKNTTTSDKTVTLKAVYALDGTAKEATKTITMEKKILMNIVINGDESIEAGGTATYKCIAIWSCGPSSTILSPTWTVAPSTYATVSTSGVVTNNNTEATDQTVRLTVSYVYDGEMNMNIKSITLKAAETAPVQKLPLTRGWNWVGFHVLPSSRKVGDVLGTEGFTANDLIQTNGGTARFNGTSWLPSTFTIDYGKMYQLYSAKDMVVNIQGSESVSSDTAVNSGWNWITNPTDMLVEPVDLFHSGGWTAGDRIQSSSRTVTFTGSKWIPSIGFTLNPGEGTQIFTAKDGQISFGKKEEDDDALYVVVDLSGGPNAETYPVLYSATGPDLSDDKCRTTELWLRKIPAGSFMMGSPAREVGRYNTDMARHQVMLTQYYYIGVFECTQKQWELVMGRNPSMYTGDTRPVEQISYDAIRGTDTTSVGWPVYGHIVDATSFMGVLQAKTGLAFDLPTEAQWEYACRAGTTSALNSGKNLTSTDVDANMTEVGRYYGNMYDGIGGYGPSTKVGCYLPNAWGLYDMHGNVAEWCLDWYGDSTSTVADEDPIGPATGSERVMRGGSWNNPAKDCRSAARLSNSSSAFLNQIGFRVAYQPPQDLYVVVDLSGGPNAASYPVRYTSKAPDLSDDKCRTSELWLRKISAGTFMMGSSAFEVGRYDNEERHQVELTNDYYIGVFECTQRQWELVMGDRPSYFRNDVYYATRPVEQVSYDMIRGTSEMAGAGWPAYGHAVDSTSFMGVLQQKTGLMFDLPTEAQWENACRAGTTTSLNSGENITKTLVDPAVNKVGRAMLDYADDMQNCTTIDGTAEVGSFRPNAWGLYDMHGNVAEWCLDWSGDYVGDEIDPTGPTTGSSRIIRGGFWYSVAQNCRSAYRLRNGPSLDVEYLGFRVACHLNPGKYAVVDLSGGIRATNYPVRYTDVPPNVDDDTCRTTELWLRRIPKGTFMMGSPENEFGRYDNEEQQEVTLKQDFYIGVFECTQKQWELVAGSNPSFGKGDCRPVDSVSYDMIRGTSATGGAGWPEYGYVVDMNSFLGILRNKTGLTFDLPMSAQWEYACRAGTTTALNSGKNLTSMESDANMDEVGRYSYNLNDGKGGYSTHTKVGSYLPNGWGLYDMHGNVQEWCLDRYGDSYRVLRGGAFCDKARLCRSASDNAAPPSNENYYYGFRLFLLLP